MFLGGHPSVASTGELNFISKSLANNEGCSCGVGIKACREWAKVFDRITQDCGFDPRQNPYRLGLWDARAFNLVDTAHQTSIRVASMQFRKALLQARELLPDSLFGFAPSPHWLTRSIHNKFHLVDIIANAWQKTHVIDSSKNAREAVELWRRKPDQVRIILLTRDGRGVYLSRRKAGRSREESISGWQNYYRKFIPLIERHVAPEHLLRLKYEDLARFSQSVGAELCKFIGIEFQPSMLDMGGTTLHLASGNDTRFSASKGIRLDERWRTDLVGDELTYFETHAGELNRRLGYH